MRVGIDAGKRHHRAVALDSDGETLFSTKAINDESQLLALIETARERADALMRCDGRWTSPAALDRVAPSECGGPG